MTKNQSSRILWGALILGAGFDVLFWKQAPGISFFIFVMLVMMAGFIITRMEGIKPAKLSWVLAGMVSFFSLMTFIREEPFTTLINGLLTLTCLGLLALTFSSGLWLHYSVADGVTGVFRLVGAALVGGSTLLSGNKKPEDINYMDGAANGQDRVSVWAVIRGFLLAIPVVFFLALLLSSADPIFSKELERFLNIDQWVEFAFQGVLIAIIAYLISGIILHVIQKSDRRDLIGVEKPWFPSFLGFTESVVILGLVNLLFAFFVAIQFQYFFGGQANISVEGYTFAEYARKGFGELITVAFLSLVLFLGLSAVTKREAINKQKWFAGLGVALVVLVVVILVSSFYRLTLLEDAYGFSRLRTYSHVFMVWLGILLAAVIGLEITNYRRGFAMAALFTIMGFGLTLNIMNVDSFILNANVNRAEVNGNLDYFYLQELSDDSVPQSLAQFRSTQNQEVKHLLGASLVCRRQVMEKRAANLNWQGYHYSFYSGLSQLQAAESELKVYEFVPAESDRYGSYVKTPIGEKECNLNSIRWD